MSSGLDAAKAGEAGRVSRMVNSINTLSSHEILYNMKGVPVIECQSISMRLNGPFLPDHLNR